MLQSFRQPLNGSEVTRPTSLTPGNVRVRSARSWKKPELTFLGGVLRVGQRDAHGQRVPCEESWRDCDQAGEAANEEAGAHEEDQRQRDFGHSEHTANESSATGRTGMRGVPEHLHQRRRRSVDGGRQSE